MSYSYYYHTNDPDATFAYAHHSDPNFANSKIIYGTSAEGLQWDYDDRLWEWDYDKHRAAWQQAREEHPQPRTARMIARYLSLYFGKPVDLVAIEAGARPDTGYPWHAFGYRFIEADAAAIDELRTTLAARLARIEAERAVYP